MQNSILNGLNILEPMFEISSKDFLKYNSQEALKNYALNCKHKELKPILKKLLINKAIWAIRAEKIILTEDYIKSQCRTDCKGAVYVKDDYGALLKRCPSINSSFCLLSLENKKSFEEEQKLKEVFFPYAIPTKYYESDIAKVNKDIRNKVYRFIQNLPEIISNGKGIFMTGNVGTGKTSILYLIIKEALQNYSCYYCTVNDVYKYLIRQNDEFIARLYYSELLLIDDLGREYMSENIDFGARQFDELIDFRYRENKSTCLTTNLMFELVKNKYPRVYDRLKEKNQFLIITGESQRISNWR